MDGIDGLLLGEAISLQFNCRFAFLRYAGLAGNIYSPSRGHEHFQQGRPNQLADL